MRVHSSLFFGTKKTHVFGQIYSLYSAENFKQTRCNSKWVQDKRREGIFCLQFRTTESFIMKQQIKKDLCQQAKLVWPRFLAASLPNTCLQVTADEEACWLYFAYFLCPHCHLRASNYAENPVGREEQHSEAEVSMLIGHGSEHERDEGKSRQTHQ